ncbi:metal ABC transporter ATP-binding protein [Alkaliphilus oremlandii]|uniref:ABC transporter related n=1 Tax=Alkaliphilus oremlandii (strain OhILAs) TaxID=350688 RepID=A8MIN9_ALKOO|nr:metal ABC transporter ATP-binding protein [Alkaliphilus oremlandii]ABW19671.1 ABC transporter related [Alkaliphilus oremlandii OhILAs]
MEKVLEVKDVFFGYNEKYILEEINLTLYKGDFLGIVGPNGSAKSTLLKIMLGILKPQKGSITLLDSTIEDFNGWGRIGYISQRVRDFNSAFPATVEEIVGANLYSKKGILKFTSKEDREKVKKALAVVDMLDYEKQLIGNLSGGQQQRVFIARALVSNPEIIFMDEPLVGVDVKSQEQFYSLMERLNKKLGITLVMVSHDIGVITNRANRVACVGNKSVFVHSTDQFNEQEYIKEVYGHNSSLLHHRH